MHYNTISFCGSMTFKYCWCYCFRGSVCLGMLSYLFVLYYCLIIIGCIDGLSGSPPQFEIVCDMPIFIALCGK